MSLLSILCHNFVSTFSPILFAPHPTPLSFQYHHRYHHHLIFHDTRNYPRLQVKPLLFRGHAISRIFWVHSAYRESSFQTQSHLYTDKSADLCVDGRSHFGVQHAPHAYTLNWSSCRVSLELDQQASLVLEGCWTYMAACYFAFRLCTGSSMLLCWKFAIKCGITSVVVT
jgi:hypothetical protein